MGPEAYVQLAKQYYAASGEHLRTFVSANWIAIVVTVAAAVLLQRFLEWRRPLPSKPFLDPTEFKPLYLAKSKPLSRNSVWLRFELPHKRQRLGLPIGQHVTFLAKDAEGKSIYRSYTPISDDDTLGYVDFVIKLYTKGKMSSIIRDMVPIYSPMLMKGPKAGLKYEPNMKKSLGMLAGGSGITPMYQVLNAILKNPDDKTQVSLIFGNIAEEDILLRKELDALAAQHDDRFKVFYVLEKPPVGWEQGDGLITQATVKQQFAPPGSDTLVLRCGPTPMMESMKKVLDAAGYSDEEQFQF